jgi:hypothetical protein
MNIVTSREELRHNIDDRIDQYINGKLSQDQIDEIWIDALCDDRHYNYLKASASLKDYYAPKPVDSSLPTGTSITEDYKDSRSITVAAIIVAIIFALLIFWGMN